MDLLSQRLKELPREDFEKLCFLLAKERHPNANVRHVEGASGDLGVDTFAGELDDGSTIWQSKAFANGVGKSQKEQIRKSMRQAVDEFKPRRWILCLSIDMDIHAHGWFQRLVTSYATTVQIGLMQGSDIVSELMHRRSIRDYFFPDAGLNVNELRSLLTQSGQRTDAEVAALTEENASQYIERLKERDSRFNYEVVIATDRKPSGMGPGPSPMFSISSGSTIVNAYARDFQALSLAPPKISVRFKGSGTSKIEEFLKSGRAQSFESGEVESVQTDISFPELQEGIRSLGIGPAAGKRVLSMRVIFGSPNRHLVYDLLQFAINRAGSEEVELVSIGNHPFTLSVVIRKEGATFNIIERWTGARFVAVKKYLDALTAINETREMEIYDLEADRRLCRMTLEATQRVPILEPGLLALITTRPE